MLPSSVVVRMWCHCDLATPPTEINYMGGDFGGLDGRPHPWGSWLVDVLREISPQQITPVWELSYRCH